jgi:hypothetical protein
MTDQTLRSIVGEYVSSVTFVADYVQFRFDGPLLNAFTMPCVRQESRRLCLGDQGYLEALVGCVGKRVRDATTNLNEVCLTLEDGNEISISLLDEDLVGPEAAYFQSDDVMQRWP